MKSKDIKYLLLAVVIMAVAGYLAYTQLVPQTAASTASAEAVKVEKVGVVPDHLDEAGLAAIKDKVRTVDFNSPIDLSGLNNKAPFGQ